MTFQPRTPIPTPALGSALLLACLALAGCATEQTVSPQAGTGTVEHTVTRELADRQSALTAHQSTLSARQSDLTARQSDLEQRLARLEQGASSVPARTEDIARQLTLLTERLGTTDQRLKELDNLVHEAMAMAAKELFLANGKEAYSASLTQDRVLYPLNDPTLDARDRAKLDELAAQVSKLDQEYHLDIQGHTDNTSTDDNNYNLGKARAEVVKRYLHEQKGIPVNRMSTTSYGSSKPLDPSGNHNRRILVRVLVLA